MTDRKQQWWQVAQFYHIYPLGFCGAPAENPGAGASPHPAPPSSPAGGAPPPAPLEALTEELPRIQSDGFNALYLGPLFESSSHGYDTADYFHLDRRLGPDDALRDLVATAHELGMRVVLDGVFNHVGRDFWAFRDLREHREASRYSDWFRGVDFSRDNGYGDGFVYEGWEGTDSLVSLKLENPEVQEHLFAAVRRMILDFDVDGLRLDVAYLLPHWFLEELRQVTETATEERRGGGERRGAAPAEEEFWLMGEVIHGDYAAMTAPGRLHSVTNYECYKGLWSSHNDRNYFEIAHSLDRLFGEGGLLSPAGDGSSPAPTVTYNFADNHDVDRVASSLAEGDHIFPLYTILWTMPGVPSVYYGSEWMISGRKENGDAELRPSRDAIPREDERLRHFLRELSRIRREQRALREGGYRQLQVTNETLAFAREIDGEQVLVAVNNAPEAVTIPVEAGTRYLDLFTGTELAPAESREQGIPLPARGSAVLRRL